MGICGSVSFEIDPTKPGHDQTAFDTFELIGLTKSEINKLYKTFLAIDQDCSCYLYPSELFSYLRMEPNELNKRIFSAFDLDKSGKLNFLEYVCAMWNFLSMDPGYLGSFAFSVFDDDGSKLLDFREIKQLVEMIQHKKYETNDGVRRLVDDLKDISHQITIDQFAKFSRENPSMCAPLVSLQFILRKRVVGDSFWTNLAERRYKVPEQNEVTYTIELCRLVQKKYDQLKLQKFAARQQQKRTESLRRIASAKATVDDESRHRNGLMLHFFRMGTPDDMAVDPTLTKKKQMDGKGKNILLRRMSSLRGRGVKVTAEGGDWEGGRGGTLDEDDVYEEEGMVGVEGEGRERGRGRTGGKPDRDRDRHTEKNKEKDKPKSMPPSRRSTTAITSPTTPTPGGGSGKLARQSMAVTNPLTRENNQSPPPPSSSSSMDTTRTKSRPTSASRRTSSLPTTTELDTTKCTSSKERTPPASARGEAASATVKANLLSRLSAGVGVDEMGGSGGGDRKKRPSSAARRQTTLPGGARGGEGGEGERRRRPTSAARKQSSLPVGSDIGAEGGQSKKPRKLQPLSTTDGGGEGVMGREKKRTKNPVKDSDKKKKKKSTKATANA